jgi:hypothetical protein
VDFGNEVDFFGDPISALSAVGFYVFQTGENAGFSGGVQTRPRNMPNIRLEIDPTGTGGYTTMVWVPDGVANASLDQWSDYIDATTTGQWYFTGGFGTASGCNQTTLCTFAAAKAAASSGIVYSVAVGKGRDNAWVGAIDGLRLNAVIYDFETDGVKAK